MDLTTNWFTDLWGTGLVQMCLSINSVNGRVDVVVKIEDGERRMGKSQRRSTRELTDNRSYKTEPIKKGVGERNP